MVVSSRHRSAANLATALTLTGLVGFCLFPFVWMLDTAFKPAAEVFRTAPTLLIEHPTLERVVN